MHDLDLRRRLRPRRCPQLPAARTRRPRFEALAIRREVLEAAHDQGRPSRLMAGADSAAGVAVEVLVEEDEVAPVRVPREPGVAAVARARAAPLRQEAARQPFGDLPGDLGEVQQPSGAYGAFDLQPAAVEVVIALERLDEEVVDREPDRTAPVGDASEDPGRAFGGVIIDAMLHAPDPEHVRLLRVNAGNRPDAVGRQELFLVEQVPEDLLEA